MYEKKLVYSKRKEFEKEFFEEEDEQCVDCSDFYGLSLISFRWL